MTPPVARQRCINPDCASEHPVSEILTACPACGELLDIVYDWDAAWPRGERSFSLFDRRGATIGPRVAAGDTGATESMLDFSGVWRFRELLAFWKHAPNGAADIVTLGEGRTNLQRADALAGRLGYDTGSGGRLYLQYEGYNPSGSFKDNGMTAAFTHARMVGATRCACASTGNTSASLAMYAAQMGLQAFVFIGEGKIAYGKLSQALDYGATTLQIAGDFDACLKRVRQIAEDKDLYASGKGVYLMNSVNPFRLEGQKTIMLRVLEGLSWQVPDWIVVPGGNLGNCSAFAKAFVELKELGLIDRVPRLAVINAAGARTLDRVYNELGVRWNGGRYDRAKLRAEYERMDAAGENADTVASAIEINRPVNLSKALRALDVMDGVVRTADDAAIIEHKALVGRHGFGCEPASGASVAGARMLLEEGVIKPTETVVCILTGHQLKDPDVTVAYHTGLPTKKAQAWLSEQPAAETTGSVANRPVRVADDLDAILAAMNGA
ncbi:MAG: threonine synthase [Phycisphaerales bacterium]|nr:threonine synthase [Planctomycetota bacterium]MCH8509614.1 threonine synthase [Phycisphaerales bacterium]